MTWAWKLIRENCTGCGICTDVCGQDAILLTRDMSYPEPIEGRCNGCYICINQCPFDAIKIENLEIKKVKK